MPAILLIKEMPKTCKECPCQMMLVCVPADEDIDEYVDPNEAKPDWCPLRSLPKKEELADDEVVELGSYNEGYDNGYGCGYVNGWNDCLDEIMGETE